MITLRCIQIFTLNKFSLTELHYHGSPENIFGKESYHPHEAAILKATFTEKFEKRKITKLGSYILLCSVTELSIYFTLSDFTISVSHLSASDL